MSRGLTVGRRNRLKWVKAVTGADAHTCAHTHTHTKRHSPSCLPPLGGYFSCFQSCRQWQGSDNSCLLWHLSGSRGDSHCGACIRRAFVRGNVHYSALKLPHTFFFLIDWHSQLEWETVQASDTYLSFSFCLLLCTWAPSDNMQIVEVMDMQVWNISLIKEAFS